MWEEKKKLRMGLQTILLFRMKSKTCRRSLMLKYSREEGELGALGVGKDSHFGSCGKYGRKDQ